MVYIRIKKSRNESAVMEAEQKNLRIQSTTKMVWHKLRSEKSAVGASGSLALHISILLTTRGNISYS